MPALSAISLVDGQSTPITHTFDPGWNNANAQQWEDRASAFPIGYNTLLFNMQRPRGNANVANRQYVLNVKLMMPYLETLGTSDSGLTPAPTVSHRLAMEQFWYLPDRSSEQQRKDLRTMGFDLRSNTHLISFIDKLALPF